MIIFTRRVMLRTPRLKDSDRFTEDKLRIREIIFRYPPLDRMRASAVMHGAVSLMIHYYFNTNFITQKALPFSLYVYRLQVSGDSLQSARR